MKTRRQLSVPGLTYLDANRGRLVQVEDDVWGQIRQANERWAGRIEVLWDKENLEFCVVEHEHGPDGVWIKDSLVYASQNLEDLLQRLERADAHVQDNVPFDVAIDKANAELEAERDARFSGQIQEAGERLMFAMKQDGLGEHMSIYGPAPRKRLADRAVPRYRIGDESRRNENSA